MTAKLLDGKKLASFRNQLVQKKIKNYIDNGNRPPKLAVILVGNDPASEIYIKHKELACKEAGILSSLHQLPASTKEAECLDLIHNLNTDKTIDGILLQLPLPNSIDKFKLFEAIDPNKDVDCFHPLNLGKLIQANSMFRPCTPVGIMRLLEHTKTLLQGKHAVIIGTSIIVGKPLAFELLNNDATVTLCHKYTKDIPSLLNKADIIISAIGKPNIISGNWLPSKSIVIDVGINRQNEGKIIGDIQFEEAINHVGWLTPVPGGVGPMTINALLENTLTAYSLNQPIAEELL